MSNAYINLATLLSARGYDKGMYFTHEECSSLFSLINARDSRIAGLEAYIDQLIEVGNGMKSFLTPYVDGFRDSYPATSAWESLVKDWKERKE